MLVSGDQIRKLIREMLSEAFGRHPDQFTTSKGRKVKYGSKAHIKDLEETMERLQLCRFRQTRNGAGRTDMTRAIGRLRTELKKARRVAELAEKEK